MALVEDDGTVGKRLVANRGASGPVVGSRLGKRSAHARFWPAILITLIVVPILVVLSFYAAIPARALGPSQVGLGTAGDFAILAKTGISNTAPTSITGDIGVSPAPAAAITGFSLVYTAGNTYATSTQVTGNVYASDYASPTPTKMTTAVTDMEAAYVDAAGRTSPDHVDLNGGTFTVAQTLAPGLYNWTTVVTISADLTLSGGPNDVWIFQVGGTLSLATYTSVILSGGAQASNIFWQASGVVTLGTYSHMEGNILAKTNIAIMTGATLEGRALAQTAVSLDAATVVLPSSAIPEFSQVMIPLIGIAFVAAMVCIVTDQRKKVR